MRDCPSTHGGAGFALGSYKCSNTEFVCGLCGQRLPIPDNWKRHEIVYPSWLHELFRASGRAEEYSVVPEWVAIYQEHASA